MNNSIQLPFSKLNRVVFNRNEIPDDLELFFMIELSKLTGFFIKRIHLKEVSKSYRSKHFNIFKFDYMDKNYILEKGILTESN